MKKTGKLNGDKVKVLRTLQMSVPQQGKAPELVDLIDKEGAWIVVEYTTGKNKGNRVPTTLENLVKT
jgi:hypothetical protein